MPDGFIYLRAAPSTCLARLKRRARGEEGGVSPDYLESLHAKHEDWCARATVCRGGVYLLRAHQSGPLRVFAAERADRRGWRWRRGVEEEREGRRGLTAPPSPSHTPQARRRRERGG